MVGFVVAGGFDRTFAELVGDCGKHSCNTVAEEAGCVQLFGRKVGRRGSCEAVRVCMVHVVCVGEFPDHTLNTPRRTETCGCACDSRM